MNKRNITVGIITMHRVLNFGSILQTYALQRAVNNLGYSSEIIDYEFPNSEHAMYLKQSDETPVILSLKSRIIGAIKRRLRGSKPTDDDIRRGKFLKFISGHLKISKDSYKNRYQIDKRLPLYDIYLTGSDQVWNPLYIGYDTTFMCGFARNGNPRISFAASMAVSKIPEQFVEYYSTELAKYSSISVREKTAIGLLSQITGKAISLVCDPTMLLTRDQWLNQLNISDCNKYFIVYVLDYTYNPYPQIFEIIENCHRRYGGKIIVLNGKINQYMKRNGATAVNTASPVDFIRYFASASFVVTSSFHGTIFSLNFKIPFMSVVDDSIGRDSRVVDLLEMLGAERFKQIYSEPVDDNKDLSYTPKISDKIEKIRNESLKFLEKALHNATI